jgi:hypothetical protein
LIHISCLATVTDGTTVIFLYVVTEGKQPKPTAICLNFPFKTKHSNCQNSKRAIVLFKELLKWGRLHFWQGFWIVSKLNRTKHRLLESVQSRSKWNQSRKLQWRSFCSAGSAATFIFSFSTHIQLIQLTTCKNWLLQ